MAIANVGVWFFDGQNPVGVDLSNLSLDFVSVSGAPGRVIETTPNLYTIVSEETWGSLDGGRTEYTAHTDFHGSGLTYDASGELTSGVVTGWDKIYPSNGPVSSSSSTAYSITGLSLPATTVADWITHHTPLADIVFAGDDSITASFASNQLFGFTGNDTIIGGGASDFISGGGAIWWDDDGNIIGNPFSAADGSNYLRGGAGPDRIVGGGGFDDISGNQGNDTAYGGPGDDWVVGGKDNDLLYGDDGGDIVHGNLGNDTCEGGEGADTVRGGQGDDSLSGGAGDDWLSGDRGSDTVSGGAGADVFHSFADAGLDRVLDFNRAEGDRVQLDPGSTYTASQAGADVVIDIAGGGQMVLVGVSMASLTDGWIYAA